MYASHSSYWAHSSTTAKSKSAAEPPRVLGRVLLPDGEVAVVRRGDEQVRERLGVVDVEQAARPRPGVDVVEVDALETLLGAHVEVAADELGDLRALLGGAGVVQHLVGPAGVGDPLVAVVQEERVDRVEVGSGLGLEAVDVADRVDARRRLVGAVAHHDIGPGGRVVAAAQLVAEQAPDSGGRVTTTVETGSSEGSSTQPPQPPISVSTAAPATTRPARTPPR